MRLLYVLSEDINRTSGGGIVHFLAVANALKKQGHDVTIVGPKYHLKTRPLPDFRTVFIPLPGRNVLSFALFPILLAIICPFIFLIRRPQAFLTRGAIGLMFLPLLIAKACRVRVALEVNGIAWSESVVRGLPRVLTWVLKWTSIIPCKIADSVISVTPEIGRELIQTANIPEKKVFPIQNGADPEEFDRSVRDAARERLGIDPGTFVVGFLGRFAHWHGVRELANSARYLPAEIRPHIRYLMVGDGPCWTETKEIVSDDLNDVVMLPGTAKREQVNDYLAIFDVGVTINNNPIIAQYGFSSLKFWEYLAAGLPVLVQDNCNLTPLVQGHSMGLIVQDADPQNVAMVVTEAYRRREEMERIGRMNRQLMVDKYSWDHVARRVANVLSGAEYID
jgi:glycosyltransferase involved in cell wall biosynthesis